MLYFDPIRKIIGLEGTASTLELIIRVFLALVFAIIIGCERSSKGHSAGLKTFVLLSFSASVCAIIDEILLSRGVNIALCSASLIIALAMMSANSVLFGSKNQIKGLTTSAWLYASGLLGLLAGFGLYTISLSLLLLIILLFLILPKLEHFLKNRSNHFEIHIELLNKNNLPSFISTLRELGVRVDDIEINQAYLSTGISVYAMRLTVLNEKLKKAKGHDDLIKALKSIDYVYYLDEII